MSTSEEPRALLAGEFWERLNCLEVRHQRLQCEHDDARRDLERIPPGEPEELREAWRRYCEVIAELECTASEFEALRACSD